VQINYLSLTAEGKKEKALTEGDGEIQASDGLARKKY